MPTSNTVPAITMPQLPPEPAGRCSNKLQVQFEMKTFSKHFVFTRMMCTRKLFLSLENCKMLFLNHCAVVHPLYSHNLPMSLSQL